MNFDNYVVLRSKSVVTPTNENLGPLARGAMTSSYGEGIQISEQELSRKERNELRRDPRVHAIAQSMPLKLISPVETKDVRGFSQSQSTWGVQAVRATDSNFNGTGITVAVLDTGIDPTHPAFTGIDIIQKNFTSESENDIHGHGTHCAGTIFGRDVNNMRIGIAREVNRVLIGKVLGNGGGSSATIAEAIQWSVNNGANVISMSLGIDFPGYVDYLVNTVGHNINLATSLALEAYRSNINLFTEVSRMVEAFGAFGNGCIILGASGNESSRPHYEIAVAPPAAGTGVVSVGALGESDSGYREAYFSNTQVDISAPGIDIVSAAPGGGLTSMSGTSMATPHVAGVAALWAQRQLEQTGRVENRSLLAQLVASGSTDNLIPNWAEEDVGTGMVQAPIN